jgi:phosphoglycerate dehydrogenase-like enzyme
MMKSFLRHLLTVGWLIYAAPLMAQSASNENDCLLCDEAAQLIERFKLREDAQPVRERENWRAPQKILTGFNERFADMVRAVAPDADVVYAKNEAELLSHIEDADVYLGDCTPELMERGVNLRWVQTPFAGANKCTSEPAFLERNILLTNMQRIYGPPIGQHAIALMLALANRLPEFNAEQDAGEWTGFMNPFQRGGRLEVAGKTLLVVGLGGIGTEIAWRAHGLGMRVIATRRSSREGPEFVDYVGLADELLQLATEAHVIASALPLTNETTGLFDEEFFSAVPEGALFINVGRGESVVTDDLLAALESGRIGGAGLDVTDPEPLPPGHPLWTAPNTILTPHVANGTRVSISRAVAIVMENLRRYVAGRPMLNVVDVERGY